jgi:TRAP-type C4-dicarboxylate transport system substrate-binding protein
MLALIGETTSDGNIRSMKNMSGMNIRTMISSDTIELIGAFDAAAERR